MDIARTPVHLQFRLARSWLLRWQGYRENAELRPARGADANPGTSHGSGQFGALGRTLPAAPTGDSGRRYTFARMAIRTQQTIWEIMSTVKTTDRMLRACTKSSPDEPPKGSSSFRSRPPHGACGRAERSGRCTRLQRRRFPKSR